MDKIDRSSNILPSNLITERGATYEFLEATPKGEQLIADYGSWLPPAITAGSARNTPMGKFEFNVRQLDANLRLFQRLYEFADSTDEQEQLQHLEHMQTSTQSIAEHIKSYYKVAQTQNEDEAASLFISAIQLDMDFLKAGFRDLHLCDSKEAHCQDPIIRKNLNEILPKIYEAVMSQTTRLLGNYQTLRNDHLETQKISNAQGMKIEVGDPRNEQAGFWVLPEGREHVDRVIADPHSNVYRIY